MLATRWFRVGACLTVVMAAGSMATGCTSPTYGTGTSAMAQLGDDIGQSVSLAPQEPKNKGVKCARSWRITKDVGSDEKYPDVSARDAAALRELGL